jgi:TRAP-type C4-dicarboxylate transport system permease small subunit
LIDGITAVANFAWVIFIAMTFGQVVARYVLGIPFQWAEELARFTLIWFSFLCSLQLVILDDHLDMQIFGSSSFIRHAVQPLKLFCIGATGVMLLVGVWDLAPVISTSRSPALGIPQIAWYLAGASAGLGFIVISVLRLITLIADTVGIRNLSRE